MIDLFQPYSRSARPGLTRLDKSLRWRTKRGTHYFGWCLTNISFGLYKQEGVRFFVSKPFVFFKVNLIDPGPIAIQTKIQWLNALWNISISDEVGPSFPLLRCF